jgi:hypothetical protein
MKYQARRTGRAEMPHVRVQRFAAGQRQKDRAQQQEGLSRLGDREIDGVCRIQRRQHLGRLHDAVDAEQREHGEPDDGHRTEEAADQRRAFALHQEQQHDDG